MGRGFYGNGKGESREPKMVRSNEKRARNAKRKVQYLQSKAQKEFKVPLTRRQSTVAFLTWVEDPNCSSERILKGFGLLAQEEGIDE
ncbi:hypothetical protein KKD03_04715 [Patescibacteria group bacterium]|nr:hypothetical protein [Patescibacteria group bacterium]